MHVCNSSLQLSPGSIRSIDHRKRSLVSRLSITERFAGTGNFHGLSRRELGQRPLRLGEKFIGLLETGEFINLIIEAQPVANTLLLPRPDRDVPDRRRRRWLHPDEVTRRPEAGCAEISPPE